MSSGSGSSRCCRRTRVGGATRSATTARWRRESSAGIGPGFPGVTWRGRCSVRGGRGGSATVATPGTAPGTGCWAGCWPRRMRPGKLTGGSASMPRSPAPSSMRRTRPARNRTRGQSRSTRICPWRSVNLQVGIGRSGGGLSTKVHAGSAGTAGRWRSSSPAASVTTGRRWRRCWPTSGPRSSPGRARAVPKRSSPTGRTRSHLPRRRRPVRVHHLDPHLAEPTTSTSFPRT